MKRVRISKYLKRGFVAGALLLSIAWTGLGVMEYKSEHIKEEKRVIYNYSMKSDVNYTVYVKPNILYEGKKLAEGQMYLTEFIDYIEADFTNTFTGSEKADIEGSYKIIAEVRGFNKKEEEKQIIWAKVFELKPVKVLKETSNSQNIKEAVKINFPEYKKFTQAILEASKVNCEVELVVKLEGKKSIKAAGQPLTDELQPALTIPLNTGYFGITKEGNSDKSDTLTETIKVPVPINKKWIQLCAGISGASLLAAILMLIFMAPLNAEDIKKKKIKKIFNQHGSRMVMVDKIKVTENQEVYQVSNIEDLIKIADEIEKPVLYEAQEELANRTKFYVKEQEILYVFEVKEESSEELTAASEGIAEKPECLAEQEEQPILKEEVMEASKDAAKTSLNETEKETLKL